MLCLWLRENSRLVILLFVWWLRLLVGLLVNSILGWLLKVCVSVICCCLLLESCVGRWFRCLFSFNCLSNVFVLLWFFVLFLLCSRVGSLMFFSVLRVGININDWKIKLMCFVCNFVCVFLFILCSGCFIRFILLLLLLLSLVRIVSKVDLFDFDLFISVMVLLCLIISLILVRMESLCFFWLMDFLRWWILIMFFVGICFFCFWFC